MIRSEIIHHLETVLKSQLWIAGNIGPEAPFLREEAQKKVNALGAAIRVIKSVDEAILGA